MHDRLKNVKQLPELDLLISLLLQLEVVTLLDLQNVLQKQHEIHGHKIEVSPEQPRPLPLQRTELSENLNAEKPVKVHT